MTTEPGTLNYSTCICILMFLMIKQISIFFKRKKKQHTIFILTAAALAITARFRNGDLDFVWTNTSQNNYEIFLSKDGRSDPWVRVFRTQYSIADIMMYNSVRITVFDQKTRSSYQHTYEGLYSFKNWIAISPSECRWFYPNLVIQTFFNLVGRTDLKLAV